MASLGPDLDAARARVVEQGLTAEAVGALTGVVSGLSLEALGPVKQLLKRYFSDQPWTAADDDALADAVGPGVGVGHADLEPGLALRWSWDDGRFRLRVADDTGADQSPATDRDDAGTGADLGALFDGVVAPEATPSPRTIRFATPPIHAGPSRTYDSAAASAVAADEPGVARLFREFDAVTNVLVGPDFVAVTIARPDKWEALLAPMLRTVTDEFTAGFTGVETSEASQPKAPVIQTLRVGSEEDPERARRGLERAWVELGTLRADRPDQLEQILAAARHSESSRRQVAATLLADAPGPIAAREWRRLLGDPSRVVRRSVVDAVADTCREEERPLLVHALDDSDPWTRWKALRGIAALGVGASRAAVQSRTDDPDFRVRLEAARMIGVHDG